jgi:hypothetical protein
MKLFKNFIFVSLFLAVSLFVAPPVFAVEVAQPEDTPVEVADPNEPAPVGDTCSCTVRIKGPGCTLAPTTRAFPVTQIKTPGGILGNIGVLPNGCPRKADYPQEHSNDPWPMSLDKCDGHSYTQTNAEQYEFSIECFGKKPDEAPALDTRTPPEGYRDGKKTGIAGILPDCAFYAYGCGDGGNANIDIFIKLAINIGKVIFSMIGTVAFVMFVYGGFTMILAFGSSEKFKKGQGILVAAVIGMMISFSAYLIVQFILKALNVGADFKIL